MPPSVPSTPSSGCEQLPFGDASKVQGRIRLRDATRKRVQKLQDNSYKIPDAVEGVIGVLN